MNNDKRKQAGKHEGSDQLEEATNHQRTEIGQAKNKKKVSNIQKYLAVAIAVHARSGTNNYKAAKAVAGVADSHFVSPIRRNRIHGEPIHDSPRLVISSAGDPAVIP